MMYCAGGEVTYRVSSILHTHNLRLTVHTVHVLHLQELVTLVNPRTEKYFRSYTHIGPKVSVAQMAGLFPLVLSWTAQNFQRAVAQFPGL